MIIAKLLLKEAGHRVMWYTPKHTPFRRSVMMALIMDSWKIIATDLSLHHIPGIKL